MFDFEKFDPYIRARSYCLSITETVLPILDNEPVLKNQLRRASTSVVLNIAEGSSRFSKADRKHFYIIARGSVFECVAITDLLLHEKKLDQSAYLSLHSTADQLSRLLFATIKGLQLN